MKGVVLPPVRRIQEDERLFQLKGGRNRRLAFGTLLANKNGKKYVFEVVTRRKLQKNGDPNPRYILVRSENANEISDNGSQVEKHYGAQPRWIAVRFDTDSYCIYIGTLKALHKLGIPMQESDLTKYECLARNRTLLDMGILES